MEAVNMIALGGVLFVFLFGFSALLRRRPQPR